MQDLGVSGSAAGYSLQGRAKLTSAPSKVSLLWVHGLTFVRE